MSHSVAHQLPRVLTQSIALSTPTTNEHGERARSSTRDSARVPSEGLNDTNFCPITVSDEQLISRVCQGDAQALTQLFQRYAKIIRGLAYQILRDTCEADDLLQDLFILILRKCGMFDATRGPARFWILQIAYHCALARRRYLNSRHFYTRVDLADVENELSDCGNGNGGRECGGDELLENSGLTRVFGGLSDDQQETLRLFFVEGYTLPEIAVKLNQTHSNVKHHYFRGLEKLRKHVFNGKLRGNSAV